MNSLRTFLLAALCATGAMFAVASNASAQCTNTCGTADDGDCDDGGPGSSYSVCELGTDCNDCGPRFCNNSCATANDGDCDDGGPGSAYSVCDLGTDCNDCGVR
ncbi:MAG: hypothetical protein H6700_08900 [Myxococcales bacterium]|nr:hypothetical protein [Myxococcales bacterium]MCB9531869.1 hypothetical protein [Myxococcales bacterium]